MKFPFFSQLDMMDCGPTCLRMISNFYGKDFSVKTLRELSGTTNQGSNFLGLSEAAEKIGLRTLAVKIDINKLIKEAPYPCIIHWNQNHFAVLYKVKNKKLIVADPAHGLITYTLEEFQKHWISDENKGIVLLVEPTPSFYKGNIYDSGEKEKLNTKKDFWRLLKFILGFKNLIFQLFIGLIVGSILQLIFPFLTQSIVDIGIQNRDVNFIYLILAAQLFLFFGRMSIELIRSWILLHITSRLNVSLVSDFFIKLMKLPINFFDVKMTGDIMQRINDHQRIQSFFTSTSLNSIFSVFQLIVLSSVVLIYSVKIFIVFILGSVLYMLWVLAFLKKRREIDYRRFDLVATNQSLVMELVSGMQEIKLHNAEKQKRWEWESLQAKIFKLISKSLKLEQIQSTGSMIINEVKNIFITVLSAKLVIDGQISLGMMLSLTYIVGQLNSPVYQFVELVLHYQDAKISLERLSEIQEKPDEENGQSNISINELTNHELHIENLSFKYPGAGSDFVLKNLTFKIPHKKVTAIVGTSGSGKSTLMKILMKFYSPTEGNVFVGDTNLEQISHKSWRNYFGAVMQEGYLFTDSVKNNIAVGSENIDLQKLNQACEIACIKEFIDTLPLGYNTKIGREGLGISTGQKQRVFIARAVFKNPECFFLDEATSSLDANNEKKIMENFDQFFIGKTVVIIAHRLSTVKNADQIIVLDKGEVSEIGNHKELIALKGRYYELVKNQLDLDA